MAVAINVCSGAAAGVRRNVLCARHVRVVVIRGNSGKAEPPGTSEGRPPDKEGTRSEDKAASSVETERLRKALEDTVQMQKVYLTKKWAAAQNWWKGADMSQMTGANSSEWYSARVNFIMRRYEDFVGLTEVKAAQASVVEYEKKFIETQEARRETQTRIAAVQQKLKDVHTELEKTHRGEDRYINLVMQEHEILKEERQLQNDFTLDEKRERECFAKLSNAVRDSHERERAQAEKTKYWSVIGSVVGTCLGIIGTTVNNRMRMRELRDLVTRSANGERLMDITENLEKSVSTHEGKLGDVVSQVQAIIDISSKNLVQLSAIQKLVDALSEASARLASSELHAQSAQLLQRSEELKRGLSASQKNVLAEVHALAARLDSSLASRHKDLVAQLSKDESARDRNLAKHLEILAHGQTGLAELIESRIRDAESLIAELHAQSGRTTRERFASAKSVDDSTLAEKLELVLEDHETRTRFTIFASAVFVTLATPIAIGIINRLL